MPRKGSALETRRYKWVFSSHRCIIRAMKYSHSTAIAEEDVKTLPESPSQEELALYSGGPSEPVADMSLHAIHHSAHPDSVFDPPITSAMLKELDNEVLNASVQIRHDLILEPQLKLRPNSQRRSSIVYQQNYKRYWAAMDLELEYFLVSGAVPHRLLRAIGEMRKLILACYPMSAMVTEGLKEFFDTDLLRHQLINRTLPLVTLIEAIANLLKQNCAPRRDLLVDHLVELAKEGRYLIMIREFFEIMELMKLDLANYHLQHLKRFSNTSIVTMERDFFQRELSKGRQGIERTRTWISISGNCDNSYFVFKQQFVETFIVPYKKFPETFYLDKTRIGTLRNELQMISIACAITSGLRQICGRNLNEDSMAELKSRIMVLVASPETHVNDIAKNVVLVLERIKAPKEIIEGCSGFIDKIIRPESPLYITILRRLHEVLSQAILQDLENINEISMQKKLGHWLVELSQLYTKLQKMLRHHWTVYHPLYEGILAGSV
jgi:hypothetical protein